MYSLAQIIRFAHFLQSRLSSLTGPACNDELIGQIASTRWRWATSALLQVLPHQSVFLTEHLLHGLFALDPRVGVQAALSLVAQRPLRGLLGLKPDRLAIPLDRLKAHLTDQHSAAASLFLEGLPQRLRKGPRFQPTDCSTPDLLAQLNSGDHLAQAFAAHAISRASTPPAGHLLPPLLKYVLSHSPAVVAHCLEAIRRIAPDQVMVAAESLLQGTCRQIAADFLVTLGEAGIERLALLTDQGQYADLGTFARALVHVAPDKALDQLETWSVGGQKERNIAADSIYELLAIELGWSWPEAPAAERIERCCRMCVRLLEDPSWNIRTSALANLAMIQWPDWASRARTMLGDPESDARFEILDTLDEHGAAFDDALVSRLLSDSNDYVRARMFARVRRLASDSQDVLSQIDALGSSTDAALRLQLIDWIVELGCPQGCEWLSRLARDVAPEVRGRATAAGLKLSADPVPWVRLVRSRLRDRDWQVRLRMAEVLGERGQADDLERVVAATSDPHEAVRRSALLSAMQLDRQRGMECAVRLLTDREGAVVRLAFEELSKRCSSDDLQMVVLQSVPNVRGNVHLLELAKAKWSHGLGEFARVALRSPDKKLRAWGITALASEVATSDVPLLKDLLREHSGDVRLAAITCLQRLAPDDLVALACARLADADARVRQVALNVLVDCGSPPPLPDLLRLARDESWDVRHTALRAIAGLDDVRVYGELVSSLSDVNGRVRRLAEEILDGHQGSVPSADIVRRHTGTTWRELAATVVAINRWAQQTGRQLLGRPVVVRNYRQGFGRTKVRSRGPVEIEVSDTPVTTCHPHGEEIMRGLVLHELGHHLCDFTVRGFKTADGMARSEKLGHLWNLLLDERLERALRSRRPEWGVYFDRLSSYAFAQPPRTVPLRHYADLLGRTVAETADAVRRGELPGTSIPASDPGGDDLVSLTPGEMLAIPGLVPPVIAFHWCLRCGFDPRLYAGQRTREAIALVPGDLKDMPHSELLELARRIAARLPDCRDAKRQMHTLRAKMDRFPAVLGTLRDVLDRLSDIQQLPEWTGTGAPGIRGTMELPVTEPSTTDRTGPRTLRLPGGRGPNLGKDRDYPPLEREVEIRFDQVRHVELVASIRKHVRQLRAYFERLGTRTVTHFGSRQGQHLDLGRIRVALWTRSPDFLIHQHEERVPSAYVGVLIDRSGSMGGERMERARRFGALVAEAAAGVAGIEGHVNGFDGCTFYRLGVFRRNAIACLEAGGGNNDSAALERAAELALASRKHNKLLIMISDGCPAECTFESLKNLVQRLTREAGVVCAQVAVAPLSEVAFPHYVDLSRFDMDEAVARFGKLLVQLTRTWY